MVIDVVDVRIGHYMGQVDCFGHGKAPVEFIGTGNGTNIGTIAAGRTVVLYIPWLPHEPGPEIPFFPFHGSHACRSITCNASALPYPAKVDLQSA
jgi:hypothetical protein